MPPRTIKGSKELGDMIKSRRNELKLTIEEAAVGAGVGAKTWSRYESGESIRRDKYKGICKVLNWVRFPMVDDEKNTITIIDEYKKRNEWSVFLEKEYGEKAALSFAAGSELLLDLIDEDLSELASLPPHSHLGQLRISVLADELPQQFLMSYDYDFLFKMKCVLKRLRSKAFSGKELIAHSVIEELLIHLSNEEGKDYIENCVEPDDLKNIKESDYLDDWPFMLFDDCDIITFLYSDDEYLSEDDTYHYIHWFDNQFYTTHYVNDQDA